jgi:hypothetical protein
MGDVYKLDVLCGTTVSFACSEKEVGKKEGKDGREYDTETKSIRYGKEPEAWVVMMIGWQTSHGSPAPTCIA